MKAVGRLILASVLTLPSAGCGGSNTPAGNASAAANIATPAPANQTAASDGGAPAVTPDAVQTGGDQNFRPPTADERAGGANANCLIRIPAGTFRGPCKFTADGISFSVEHPNGMPMIGNVQSFWIEADTRTDARFTGSDPQEGSQDYGIVTRPSTRDACWGNETASICAYAF